MTSIKSKFVCGVFAAALAITTGPGWAGHSTEVFGTSDVAKGEEFYNGTCVACHSENGKGAFPGVPNFKSRKGPLNKLDGELLHNIVEGFESPRSMMAMPAMGGNPDLSEQDIANIITYIREEFGR